MAIRIMAMLAFNGKRPNAAFELLNQAISFEPQNPELHGGFMATLLTSGKVEKGD